MNPEDGLRLQGRMRRRVAYQIVAHHYGLFGGWFGEREEHVRFLAFFDYTRSKRLMNERAFTRFWPHHVAGEWLGPYSDN